MSAREKFMLVSNFRPAVGVRRVQVSENPAQHAAAARTRQKPSGNEEWSLEQITNLGGRAPVYSELLGFFGESPIEIRIKKKGRDNDFAWEDLRTWPDVGFHRPGNRYMDRFCKNMPEVRPRDASASLTRACSDSAHDGGRIVFGWGPQWTIERKGYGKCDHFAHETFCDVPKELYDFVWQKAVKAAVEVDEGS